MSIKVQSADGVVHEFPDGTDQSVIDQAMKSYAQNLAGRGPSTPGGTPTPVPGPGAGATAEAVGEAVRGVGAKAPLTGTQSAAGWGRAVQNGLMLGFGDEASAGLQATLDWLGGGLGLSAETGGWSKAYDERLAQGRALDQQFAAENPVMAQVGEGLGGAAGAFMAPGRLVMGQGQGIGAQMARGAGTGATAGAAYGFGSGEGGVENRLGSAVEGAAMGAGLGAAVPPLMGFAGALGRLGRRALQAANPQEMAGQKVLEAFGRDKVSLADALQQYALRQQQGMAPEMLLNLGGKNVQDLGRAAAAVPGEGKNVAVQRLREAILQEGDNLGSALDRHIVANDGYDTIKMLQDQRAQSARPLYDRAFEVGSGVTNDRLQAILADPIMQGGLKRGLEVQRIEALARGEKFNPTDYAITGFNEAGDPIISGVPNFRLLDAAKRGLDAILEDYRDTVTGRLVLDQRGRAIDELRRAYVAELRRLNPAYGEALDSWSGPSQGIDAINLGRNLLTMGEGSFRTAVGRLRPDDIPFVQVGLRQSLEDRIASGKDTGNIVESLFSKRGLRDRLAPLFDGPEQLDAFLTEIQRMREVGVQARATLPGAGSQTALREIDQGDLAADPYLRLGADVVEQGPVGALVSAGARLLQPAKGFKEQTAGKLVDMLVNRVDPQLIEALLQAQKRSQAQQLRNRRLNLGVIGAGVPALSED